MSTLLEQASLIMIPSGYKEDVVYSVIPETGAGDLSFTRASNGTRINSSGLVEVTPWNLYTYSEVFSNSIWANGNATITDNTTTAPNGTLTADSIFEQAVNDYQIRGQNYSMVDGETFTYSIYVKANTRNFFRILVGNGVLLIGQFAYFDLVNLTTTTSSSQITSSITSVGNGWCKIVISFTCNKTGTDAIYFGPSPNMTSGYSPFVGNASNGVYIWGAQLNIGSTAKPYFPTTDRLNVPRLTYQNGGGGCPSLLLEKQSTNSFLYSEQLDNATWIKGGNASVTANSIVSPDGTQNADTATVSGPNLVFVYQLSDSAATTWTQSIYAKKGTNKYVSIAMASLTLVNQRYQPVFNLDDGTIQAQNTSGTNVTNTSCSITPVGNGWYRITATGTFAGGSDKCYIVLQSSNNTNYQPDTTTGSLDWQNATNGNCYYWGAQCEPSSYPTSYIPTTSASATRVADFATTNNISSLFGSTEGSFFIELTQDSTNSNGAIPLFLRSSIGGAYNRATYLQMGGGDITLAVYDGGTNQANIGSSAIFTNGQKLKVAFAYKQNDFAFYVNGSLIGTDNSGNISSSLAFIDLGTYSGATFQYTGTISEAVLFPTRLTNTQLAQLTA